MKIIGKQIVVELPEKWKPGIDYNPGDRSENWMEFGRNKALSEVAKMNPALEVDVDMLSKAIQKYFGIMEVHPNDMTKFDVAKTVEKVANWGITRGLAQALASDPSKWMKRKDSNGKM